MTGDVHFWQGEFIGDDEAAKRLVDLPAVVEAALAEPLDTDTVLAACDALSTALRDRARGVRARLAQPLLDAGTDAAEADAVLTEIAEAVSRTALTRKLRRELGGPAPERLTRPDARSTVFEAWAPVGLVVHIAPGNSAGVAPLSVIEGLLAGNVNVLKTSSGDTALAQLLLAELAAADPTGAIASRLIALRFPSSRQEWLRDICAAADAVAVWGGEAAVEGVAAHVPAGCRLVEWGHRISFGYLTRDVWADPRTLAALAVDVCRFEQQACSSPQVVYLDTDDTQEVFDFARRFAAVLREVSAERPVPRIDEAARAEITTTELVARLESHLGLTQVITAEDGSWRVLADSRPALTASPLHRSIWVKPLPRARMTSVLRPMRRYLQTAAIGGGRSDIAVLSRAAIAAGVLRVTPVGAMPDSYHGEPHDGVYALQRYSRRVSVQADDRFADVACLDDLVRPVIPPAPPSGPLLDKAGVQRALRDIDPDDAQLYFRSGGTTGTPALSVFTHDDYDTQMRAGAHGLLAAGFDPRHDRAANLFFCGGMYGSFISFFSILERLTATQIPIAAGSDHRAIAEALIEYRVNTVFGMPSYLWQLFHSQADLLRPYGGIRKVFYGGEHFTAEQRRTLEADFGVEVIRSAAYGSTDLGPLGYQCAYAEGSVHHVLTELHILEVLDPQADRPVPDGQPGRLVFTSRVRQGQRLERYDIGDLGRTVPGECGCGSRTPRVELLGRHGDVVRVGTYFYNYRQFVRTAEERLAYRGELQMVLDRGADREHLTLRLDRRYAPSAQAARDAFLDGCAELRGAVAEELLDCSVELIDTDDFERAATSGKLRSVIDRRR